MAKEIKEPPQDGYSYFLDSFSEDPMDDHISPFLRELFGYGAAPQGYKMVRAFLASKKDDLYEVNAVESIFGAEGELVDAFKRYIDNVLISNQSSPYRNYEDFITKFKKADENYKRDNGGSQYYERNIIHRHFTNFVTGFAADNFDAMYSHVESLNLSLSDLEAKVKKQQEAKWEKSEALVVKQYAEQPGFNSQAAKAEESKKNSGVLVATKEIQPQASVQMMSQQAQPVPKTAAVVDRQVGSAMTVVQKQDKKQSVSNPINPQDTQGEPSGGQQVLEGIHESSKEQVANIIDKGYDQFGMNFYLQFYQLYSKNSIAENAKLTQPQSLEKISQEEQKQYIKNQVLSMSEKLLTQVLTFLQQAYNSLSKAENDKKSKK